MDGQRLTDELMISHVDDKGWTIIFKLKIKYAVKPFPD